MGWGVIVEDEVEEEEEVEVEEMGKEEDDGKNEEEELKLREEEEDTEGVGVGAVARGSVSTSDFIRTLHVPFSIALSLLFSCNSAGSMRNIPRVLTSSRRSHDALKGDKESELRPDFGTSFCEMNK